MLVMMTALTGGLYPLAVTMISRAAFPRQSCGTLLYQGNRAVGSELIGQSFTSPKYFWGRLSATAPVPYNAAASTGSNYGPRHPGLHEAAKTRLAALNAAGTASERVPVDLVTASGSGLDPHISPAAAEVQIARVATARQMPEDVVRELVRQYTERRQLGLMGEPRVHVLLLNLALDQRKEQ